MTTLLLVTMRWPNDKALTELVEAEIPHLGNHFDRIRVAPAMPRGPVARDLPSGVEIDYSLAEALVSRQSRWGESGRFIPVLLNLARRNPAGLGFTSSDLAADFANPNWWRRTIMARGETNIVRRWAATQEMPDIAYSYWFVAATLGMRQAWPSVPIVSRAHGSDLYAYSVGMHSLPYQREQVLACDRVACVSSHGERYLENLYPAARDRVVFRRLGIPDPGVLAPAGSFPEAIKVLSVSTLKPNKRVTLIAAAVANLAARGVPTHWTHLGDGPDQAAVEAALSQAPQTLTWELPGLVDVLEVRQKMKTGGFDVFVNVSLSEGAPVSIMEAQSVGIPTVATDVGGSAEVAEPGLNVIIDPAATPAELADALQAAASLDPRLRPERRQRWAERYNGETNYEAFASELADLAAANPRANVGS